MDPKKPEAAPRRPPGSLKEPHKELQGGAQGAMRNHGNHDLGKKKPFFFEYWMEPMIWVKQKNFFLQLILLLVMETMIWVKKTFFL